jgi:hypothetical protein
MGVQTVTHEVRLQQWSKIVHTCRSSGKTIKGWCAENNINLKTYYHWQKRVCEETCRELAVMKKQDPENVPVRGGALFAELTVAKQHAGKVALTICREDMQIHIYCGADAMTVESALRALASLC